MKTALDRHGGHAAASLYPHNSVLRAGISPEYGRLTGLGASFTQPPMDVGPVVSAVFDDTLNRRQRNPSMRR